MILVKSQTPINLSVPDHRELDRGLLRVLIRDAGMTVEDFLKLL
jgi:hypothetical protein